MARAESSLAALRIRCHAYALVAALFASAVALPPPDADGRVPLRCCGILQTPYFVRDNTAASTGYFGGLAVDYMKRLQETPGSGFKCVPEQMKVFNAIKEENQGFSGFVREMAECSEDGDSAKCQCDLGVQGFSITTEWNALVDFVTPFNTDVFQFVTRVSNLRDAYQKSKLWFLQAFSLPVWMGIWGLMLMLVFVTLFDGKFAPPPPHKTNREPPKRTPNFLGKAKRFMLDEKLFYRIRMAAYHVSMFFSTRTSWLFLGYHFFGELQAAAWKIFLLAILLLFFLLATRF